MMDLHVEFKEVNDSHGHLIGDGVLRDVAHRLTACLRGYDYLGRYGGEEFLIIIPSCEAANLLASAERLRKSIADSPIETAAGPIRCTLSVGVISAHLTGAESAPDYESLLRASDLALYQAKANGRNRVEAAFGYQTTFARTAE